MGGLSFREAHFMAETLAATGQLCSMDLMEVNPGIGEKPNLVYVRRHRRHYKAIARSLATVLRCGTSTAAVGVSVQGCHKATLACLVCGCVGAGGSELADVTVRLGIELCASALGRTIL